MTKFKLRTFFTLAVAVFFAIACGSDEKNDANTASGSTGTAGAGTSGAGSSKAVSIYETAKNAGTFKTLLAAVDAADLKDTLSGVGNFTVFAPNDDAFAKIPKPVLDMIIKDKEMLKGILLYHVVGKNLDAASVLKEKKLETAAKIDLLVTTKDGAAFVNGKKIIKTDIKANNGIIHVVEDVIQPPKNLVEVAKENKFNTLLTAVKAAGLEETLAKGGPFTVFAPTDEAFAKIDKKTLEAVLADKALLTKILTYHVVSGKTYDFDLKDESTKVKTVQGNELEIQVKDGAAKLIGKKGEAKITATNVLGSNGVVHVIDTVVFPE